jgi:hypothetical protein
MASNDLELLDLVLHDPDRYLVQPSISTYGAFEVGYSSGKAKGTFEHRTTEHLADFLILKFQVPREWPSSIGSHSYLRFFAGDGCAGLIRYAAVLKEFYSLYPQQQIREHLAYEAFDFTLLCESIRAHPAMYWGNQNHLIALAAFFDGRIETETERHGSSQTRELLNDFQKWLNERLPLSINKPWHRVLNFYAFGSVNVAYKEFWSYMDLFRSGEPPNKKTAAAEDAVEIREESEDARTSPGKMLSRRIH